MTAHRPRQTHRAAAQRGPGPVWFGGAAILPLRLGHYTDVIDASAKLAQFVVSYYVRLMHRLLVRLGLPTESIMLSTVGPTARAFQSLARITESVCELPEPVLACPCATISWLRALPSVPARIVGRAVSGRPRGLRCTSVRTIGSVLPGRPARNLSTTLRQVPRRIYCS